MRLLYIRACGVNNWIIYKEGTGQLLRTQLLPWQQETVKKKVLAW